jgi:hypothetical protein
MKPSTGKNKVAQASEVYAMFSLKSTGLLAMLPTGLRFSSPPPMAKGNRGCKTKCSGYKFPEWLVRAGIVPASRANHGARLFIESAKELVPVKGFPGSGPVVDPAQYPLRPGPHAIQRKNRSIVNTLGQPA